VGKHVSASLSLAWLDSRCRREGRVNLTEVLVEMEIIEAMSEDLEGLEGHSGKMNVIEHDCQWIMR
jgi:hypothetical protein